MSVEKLKIQRNGRLTAIGHGLTSTVTVSDIVSCTGIEEGEDSSSITMARDEAERILGAWMGNGVGTVERFTAAFGLKNVLSSRFCILHLLRLA
jgi:hypothetical protein